MLVRAEHTPSQETRKVKNEANYLDVCHVSVLPDLSHITAHRENNNSFTVRLGIERTHYLDAPGQ